MIWAGFGLPVSVSGTLVECLLWSWATERSARTQSRILNWATLRFAHMLWYCHIIFSKIACNLQYVLSLHTALKSHDTVVLYSLKCLLLTYWYTVYTITACCNEVMWPSTIMRLIEMSILTYSILFHILPTIFLISISALLSRTLVFHQECVCQWSGQAFLWLRSVQVITRSLALLHTQLTEYICVFTEPAMGTRCVAREQCPMATAEAHAGTRTILREE